MIKQTLILVSLLIFTDLTDLNAQADDLSSSKPYDIVDITSMNQFHQGLAKYKLGKYVEAIYEYDKGVLSKPSYSLFYGRGITNWQKERDLNLSPPDVLQRELNRLTMVVVNYIEEL